jgi:hypothetical protein
MFYRLYIFRITNIYNKYVVNVYLVFHIILIIFIVLQIYLIIFLCIGIKIFSFAYIFYYLKYIFL